MGKDVSFFNKYMLTFVLIRGTIRACGGMPVNRRSDHGMKAAGAVAGALGIFVVFVLAPYWGVQMRSAYPTDRDLFWLLLLYVWATALPGFWALFEYFRVCKEIRRDNSFSRENVRSLRAIFRLLLMMSAMLLLGAVALFTLRQWHPTVILLLLMGAASSALVAVLANALSQLIRRAAELKDENDLTI